MQIGCSVSFLVPALSWFAAIWAGCVALALSIDLCQRRQHSAPKLAALALLVLTSGLGLLALPALLIGHVVGRRRARRAMPTHAAAGA